MNEKERFAALEERLQKIASPGIHPGLARLERLLSCVGMPQDKFPAVHIAGTNGKGSAAAGIESVLRSSGYRTALYTSPHLVEFSERLMIDNKPVSAERWNYAVDRLHAAIKSSQALTDEPPTYFELATAAAMLMTAESSPDAAVFETGMGGRLDASNMLGNVKLSVITPIGLDHTEYLGDTLEKVAAEKFAIMRGGTPAIFFGDSRLDAQFIVDAKLHGAFPNIFSSSYKITDAEYSLNGTDFTLEDLNGGKERYHTPLVGTFQSDNAAFAVAASRLLKRSFPDISESTIKKGIENIQWPGRMETLSRSPLIIVDGGHNPHAMKRVAETLRVLMHGARVCIVIAMMKDKAVDEALSLLKDINAELYCTQVPNNRRSMKAEDMLGHARSCGLAAAGCWEDPVAAAVAAVQKDAPVLCCGSLFLVGYMKEHLHELQGI